MKLGIRGGMARFGAAAVIGLGTLVGAATPAQAAPAITDVVIVPGQLFGSTPYQPLANQLRGNGFRTHMLDLPGTDLRGEPVSIGKRIDAVRAAHPNTRIALVGHSIGGVTARWYLKELGGAAKVAAYVAIGSPQYGSAGGCGGRPGGDICPGTSYLAELNGGDDTPGSTRYFGIRSEREFADGHLDGGQCRVEPVRGYAPLPNFGIEHTLEPFDPEITDAVVTALSGRCDGEFVTEPDGVLTYEKSEYPGGEPDWSPAA